MNRNWIRKIQEALEQKLTEEELLHLFGLSRTEMLKLLRSSHVRQEIRNLAEMPQYSCAVSYTHLDVYKRQES